MSLRSIAASGLDEVRRMWIRQARPWPSEGGRQAAGSVLVVGIYLSQRRNTAAWAARDFACSRHRAVSQRWASIGPASSDPVLSSHTTLVVREPTPRSVLLNALLAQADLNAFDHVVVCDDDIVFRRGTLERFLALQDRHDLALAQPARTRNSWIDHPITRQMPEAVCRYTRFVEIGPLFSMRRDLYAHLLPLDTASPMGLGLDLMWPVIVESLGLKMGIIDETPVDHSLRKPRSGYDNREAHASMLRMLADRPHLSFEEAQTVTRTVLR